MKTNRFEIMAKFTVYILVYVLAGIDFFVGGFWGLYLLIRIFHKVFGLIGVILGLILSPITFAIGPLYALIVWKYWLPSVVCYGSTILFIILLGIGQAISKLDNDKVVRRGQMKQRLFGVISAIVVLILIAGLLVVGRESCKNRSKIEVVPSKSIVGVKIGMTEEQVNAILGTPMQAFSPEKLGMVGRFYEIPSNQDVIEKDIPAGLKVFIYSKVPLSVVFESNRVSRMQLYYCKNVSVKDHPFLEFRYLTEKQLNSIGKHNMLRNKHAEEQLLYQSPPGTMIEYYDCFYSKEIGLMLGLVFDKNKEKTSEHFIGVNYIGVSR